MLVSKAKEELSQLGSQKRRRYTDQSADRDQVHAKCPLQPGGKTFWLPPTVARTVAGAFASA